MVERYEISTRDVFYQIFVGSFADGNGDGIGDLQGITRNLDYLNDGKGGGLGVNGIWLTPIHASDSFHKYDALDYEKVASSFGEEKDLVELLREAHRRGIKVILDLVFNCVSRDHPWFREALENKGSRYRDYFYFWDSCAPEDGYSLDAKWVDYPVWQNTAEDPYIGIYGPGMPDLNFHNQEVRQACKAVAAYWLGLGVDGFRLDSALHLFSPFEAPDQDFHQMNIDWWKEFYDHCRQIKPDVYLVGEVWGDNQTRARYMQSLGSDFHFFLGDAIHEVLTGKMTAKAFCDFLETEYAGFRHYNGENYINAPFLSNHDQPRFAGNGCTLEQLKMAANIYLTLEGLPFVYYAEELGAQGPRRDGVLPELGFDWPNGPEDIFVQNRAAFPWGNRYQTGQIFYTDGGNIPNLPEQMADKQSLYHHYKALIHLRKEFGAFDRGQLQLVDVGSEWIGYQLDNGQQRILLVHNPSPTARTYCPQSSWRYVTDINRNQRREVSGKMTVEGWSSYLFSE